MPVEKEPGTYRAADFAEELSTTEEGSEDGLEVEEAQGATTDGVEDAEPTEDEETQTDGDDFDDPDADDGNDDAAEDGEDDGIPEIDESTPERLRQQWKGVLKKQKQLEAQEKEVQNLRDYARAFSDPQEAKDAYEFLGSQLARLHGWDNAPSSKDTPRIADALPDDVEWASDGEKVLADMVKRQDAQISKLTELLERQESERESARKRSEQQDFIRRETPKVISRAKAEHNGFKVTPEMVSKAVEAFPSLQPYHAVMAAYHKALAKHYGQTSQTKRGPGAPPKQKMTGAQTPEPGRWRAADAAAFLGLSE